MKCSNCRNDEFKNVTRQHVVKTRHAEKQEMVIENLPVHECKVCGETIIPESSEKFIELIRTKIRQEMEQLVEEENEAYPQVNLSRIKDVFRKLIG